MRSSRQIQFAKVSKFRLIGNLLFKREQKYISHELRLNGKNPLSVSGSVLDNEWFRRGFFRQLRENHINFKFVSKKQDTAMSDIDLMVVSDSLTYADIFATLEDSTNRLGRKVNPTVYSPQELAKRRKQGNAFVTRVLAQPKIWLIDGERDIAA